MAGLSVYRLERGAPMRVGLIEGEGTSFSYDAAYLVLPKAAPLSLSLPLEARAFDATELRPYFEGLLAEGQARSALAAELGLGEDDWLGLLAACGEECIGDVLICEEGAVPEVGETEYAPLADAELRAMFLSETDVARENVRTRLSLAGTQSKTALAHDPSQPLNVGWLRPVGLSASTHILKTSHLRDLPEVEFLCMSAARACGADVAPVALLDFGSPALAIERFDRRACLMGGRMVVERLHQEDVAQALGVTGGSKYAELEGGSVRAMVRLMCSHSVRPARDVSSLAQAVCLNYLVGNCDAHLKNFSILHEGAGRGGRALVSLAPAYDIVSTTYFPHHPRRLAMRVGDALTIDDVTPESFGVLARDLGIKDGALRRIARPLVEGLADCVVRAGEGEFGPVLESTPYVAEDLAEDIAPRVRILEQYCEG